MREVNLHKAIAMGDKAATKEAMPKVGNGKFANGGKVDSCKCKAEGKKCGGKVGKK